MISKSAAASCVRHRLEEENHRLITINGRGYNSHFFSSLMIICYFCFVVFLACLAQFPDSIRVHERELTFFPLLTRLSCCFFHFVFFFRCERREDAVCVAAEDDDDENFNVLV